LLKFLRRADFSGRCALLLGTTILAGSNALAQDYFVSVTDSRAANTNSGAETAPWKSVSNWSSFKSGDRVFFESGQTFPISISISTPNLTVASYDLGIAPDSAKGKATIQPPGGNAITLLNAGGVTIKNLILVGGAPGPSHASNPAPATYPEPTIVNSKIGNGIVLENTQATSHYVGSTIVWVNVPISGITISGVEINGFVGGADSNNNPSAGNGIQLATGFFDKLTISGNFIHDNWQNGISGGGNGLFNANGTNASGNFATGDYYQYGITNLLVQNNQVYNNRGIRNYSATFTGSGIFLAGVQNGLVEYNEVYGNGGDSEHSPNGPAGIWFVLSDRVTIQYNESHHHLRSPQLPSALASDLDGFDVDGGNTNFLVQYNYSHDNGGAGYLDCQYGGIGPHLGNVIRFNISMNDSQQNNYGGIQIGTNGGIEIAGDQIYNNIVIVGSGANAYPISSSYHPSTMSPRNAGFVAWNNLFVTTNGSEPYLLGSDVMGANPLTGNYYLKASSDSDVNLLDMVEGPFEAGAPTLGSLNSSILMSNLAPVFDLASRTPASTNPMVKDSKTIAPPVDVCAQQGITYCAINGSTRLALPAASTDFFGNSVSLSSTAFVGVTRTVAKGESTVPTPTPTPTQPTPTPTPTSAAISASPLYSGLGANLCLDVYGFSHANGATVDLWQCNGGTNQAFSYNPTSKLIQEFKGTALCLEEKASTTSNGTLVDSSACTGAANQQWTYSATSKTLKNAASGRCLDVYNLKTANGSEIDTWDCNGGKNQEWTF
jgi:hypothetical protein